MSGWPILDQIHVIAAIGAILVGLVVFWLSKGGKAHRVFPYVYLGAILLTCIVVIFVPTAVLQFGDSGWGFIHLFTMIGGLSSLVGIFALWRWHRTGDKGWLRNRQERFAYSHAGLLIVERSQFVTNPRFGFVGVLTSQQFWISFVSLNTLTLAVAGCFV